MDLSPSHTVRGAMDGVLVGEVYVTRDIKASQTKLGRGGEGGEGGWRKGMMSGGGEGRLFSLIPPFLYSWS